MDVWQAGARSSHRPDAVATYVTAKEDAWMSDNDAIGYGVVKKDAPTFYFVGVSTSHSSIMRVFPRWADALGHPEVAIEGVDHKLHDNPEAYRQTVAQIKYDPLSLGALVTSHKVSVYEAAGDMFDYLDSSTLTTGEISCISKRDGLLEGRAKDPLTAGMSLDAVLGRDYFARSGGHVLNFGAGGSGVAIAIHLINKQAPGDRPARFIMVNRSERRLAKLHRIVDESQTDIEFEYVCNEDPMRNDVIMGDLPPGSVVINATGMGKDLPGSPVTDAGRFPSDGIAWEINYRGELRFWHQAIAQKESRNLTVEDGWLYFLYGWTEHISEVLHITMTNEVFGQLGRIAEGLRPPLVSKSVT